jgi:molybdate transport system ATP-binding protein
MIELDFHKVLMSANGSFELNVDLSIQQGQFVSIYGGSGAGKTTILRLIAGLIKADMGNISVNKECWYDAAKRINLSPQKRKVGFVFQDYALFPNMTVKQNLEFALERGQSKDIIKELIEVIELTDLQVRLPETLSGGQKQRVALARALVQKPSILLLDEPLSALDDAMRHKLQDYLINVHKKYELTTFLVTHDISEVFRLSDYVIKIEAGKIVEEGKAEELFIENQITGKYKTIGSVLSIQKSDVVNVVSVLSANNVIKIIATDEEVLELKAGDKVMIASKAFNPVIVPID